jgi:hypothetical protein
MLGPKTASSWGRREGPHLYKLFGGYTVVALSFGLSSEEDPLHKVYVYVSPKREGEERHTHTLYEGDPIRTPRHLPRS